MIWADSAIQELCDLYATGQSCSQIGAVLGVSRNAVIGKVHRLGLPLRGPSKPKKLDAAAEEARRLKHRQTQTNGQRLRRLLERGEKMERHAISLPEFMGALNIPLVDLRDFSSSESNQCRFIASEPPGPDYPTCGNETLPGESYCPHCMKITHRHAFELSESDKLKKRGHFIRIGNASKLGRTLDMGDVA